MKTLQQAFRERKSRIDFIEREARQVLSQFCERNGFLIVGRKKEIESLQDKIESGRYKKFSDVDDIIAFSIIIDTSDQERDVLSFVKRSFNVISIKKGKTLADERVFDFDCTRLYCKLRDNLQTGINEITFELQIRTLLQHAWSKITHSLVYKPALYDVRAGRLAAELYHRPS
ncbi:MAG: hypothetical protein ACK5W0_07165 [Labrys sp. (in: a-proteobacteria)]|jgi:ppGpp synthetase/RelA/SpoT-type nucleotidyltranferase